MVSGVKVQRIWPSDSSRWRPKELRSAERGSRQVLGAESVKLQYFYLVLNPSVELVLFNCQIIARLKV